MNTEQGIYTATTTASMQRWHQMLADADLSQLDVLLHEDVVFRSPIAFKPYAGKAVVTFILSNVIQVFEDFGRADGATHATV